MKLTIGTHWIGLSVFKLENIAFFSIKMFWAASYLKFSTIKVICYCYNLAIIQ